MIALISGARESRLDFVSRPSKTDASAREYVKAHLLRVTVGAFQPQSMEPLRSMRFQAIGIPFAFVRRIARGKWVNDGT